MEKRGPPTLSDLDVLEGHLRAGVADEHLSVEGEHDVHLRQVDHAARPRRPTATGARTARCPRANAGPEHTQKKMMMMEQARSISNQTTACIRLPSNTQGMDLKA